MANSRLRIDFLDGLRGLSALYVVFYHATLFTQHNLIFSNNIILNVIQRFFSLGHISVAIFIVLSGYCLAIPVVNNELALNGGFNRYIKRRAKRIIPPYYIALLVSIAVYFLFPLLQTPQYTAWDSKIPITWTNVLTHFLIIQNLNSNWIIKINGAHWSVATEWQIYFLFPVMLYLWKKYNLSISFILSCIFSVLLYKLIPFAHPQYILLFFMGVISAYFSLNREIKDKSYSFKKVVIALIILIPVLIITGKEWLPPFGYEFLLGAIFSYLVYQMVLAKKTGKDTLADKVLTSKIPVNLGKISYSLYLIHGPFLALINLYYLQYFHFSYDTQLILMWMTAVPIVVILGSLFWKLCESHFLNA